MSIIVKPKSAIFDNGVEKVGGADPYVECRLGEQKVKGNVCKSGGNRPSWYSDIILEPNPSVLTFYVWDQDTVGSQDLMGVGTYELNTVYENPGHVYEEQILMSYKQKPSGVLKISIQFNGSAIKKEQFKITQQNIQNKINQIPSNLANVQKIELSQNQKKEQYKFLIKQVQILKNKNKNLLEKVQKIQDQNKDLKQQMKKNNQQFDQKLQKIREQFLLKGQSKQKTKQKKVQQKIEQKKANKSQLLKPAINNLEMNILKQKIQQLIVRTQYICLTPGVPQGFSSKFIIDGYNLKYIGEKAHTQFIFNEPISASFVHSFTIKVVKTADRFIMIGVMDYNKQKNERNSHSSQNAICYYGYNGRKFPTTQKEGEGFFQGDLVQVIIDRVKKSIKWAVNGYQKAQISHQLLGDKNRIIMPFVELWSENDEVQWC